MKPNASVEAACLVESERSMSVNEIEQAIERLGKWVQTEAEWRLVVLPSEPNPGEIWTCDGVRYYIHAIALTENDVMIEYCEDNGSIDGDILCCNPRYFARHFTREEAEAAPKERNT